jgi:microcystin-dependent protein
MGNGHTLGEAAGSTSVTVNIQQLPTHLHLLQGTSATGNSNVNVNSLFGVSQTPIYTPPQNLTPLNPQSVTNVGGSQPHNNMMPYLVLNFCIALQGIFPSQT